MSSVIVFAGPGNNGGDGWVVGGALAERGIPVVMCQIGERRTPDADRAAAWMRERHSLGSPTGAPPYVLVDALLGTGSSGEPRGDIAVAIHDVARFRAEGVPVISLDVPSGLDATTGASTGSVVADLTLAFGTCKRGHLVARGRCGEIVVLDIGLGVHADLDDGAPTLVDEGWVASRIPAIPAESHKGIRRRIVIVGGAPGMAGAPLLAGRGATRSGVGMVRVVVAQTSLPALQVGIPEATAATWPADDVGAHAIVDDYAHALLIGPGIGRSPEARRLVERMLRVFAGPVVLDADVFTHFAGDVPALRTVLAGRPAVITPHASEFARLSGHSTDEVLAGRFDLPRELARALGCVVLLKGVPTVVADTDGEMVVSAAGTPALAAAGSGDALGGIVATLLAQSGNPLHAAACGAWVHGRAAELANAGRPVRGLVLDDILASLPEVWRFDSVPLSAPVLAQLPVVGDPPPRHG